MRTQAVSTQARCSHDSPDMCRLIICRKTSPQPGWNMVLNVCWNDSTALWHSIAVEEQLQRCAALLSLLGHKTNTKSFVVLGRLFLRTAKQKNTLQMHLGRYTDPCSFTTFLFSIPVCNKTYLLRWVHIMVSTCAHTTLFSS